MRLPLLSLVFLFFSISQIQAFLTASTGFEYLNRQGWYIQGVGGHAFWNSSNDTSLELQSMGAVSSAPSDSDSGLVRVGHDILLGGALGYYFDPIRLEAEFIYRKDNVEDCLQVTSGPLETITTVAMGHRFGHTPRWNVMGNVHYDYKLINRVLISLGGGVGFAQTILSTTGTTTDGSTVVSFCLEEKDYRFAFQLIGGVTIELNDWLSIIGQYKLFGTISPQVLKRSTIRGTVTSTAILSGKDAPLIQSGEVGLRVSL